MMMSYFNSFFSASIGAAILLSSSLCFGITELSNSDSLDATVKDLNVTSSSEFQTAVGPHNQWSQNQLSFTFDASQQPNASGTFQGIVSFPNRVQYSVSGIIGVGGNPVTLEVGPPSLLGNYLVTFVVTSLNGSIDHSQGPYGTVQNLTNGDQLQTTFNVNNSGDQSSATFLNRL
jgi:hypothetical protein